MGNEKKPLRERDPVLGYDFDVEDQWHETVKRHYPFLYDGTKGAQRYSPTFTEVKRDTLVRFRGSMTYVAPGQDSVSTITGKYQRSNGAEREYRWRLNYLPGD